jgi:hypothetical protein
VTDPDIQFLILRLLERSPATAEQLWLRGCSAGIEKSLKTYRRALDELQQHGMRFTRLNMTYAVPQSIAYCEALAGIFRRLVETKSAWRSVVYGDVDRRHLARLLCIKPAPAEFLWQLLSAAVESRLVEFQYAPQHPGTREYVRVNPPARNICTPRGMIPVSMAVHYLVFAGQHAVLLGESMVDGAMELRQYEVAGVGKLHLRGVTARRLKANPAELYRDSVYVWLGGDIHEVELEDHADPAGRVCVTRVNGEDEILAYVMASMGNLRFKKAPQAIIQRARELSLPLDRIFRTVSEL